MIAKADSLQVEEFATAARISRDIRARKYAVVDLVAATLERAERLNPELNAYSCLLRDRAMRRATQLDQILTAGGDPGPLVGVPFGVKNLFDIQGQVTLAGSKINRDLSVSAKDALLVERLESAGAILIGALSMGEYAYDFTGENEHYGACRNPWDLQRMSGGSSSGSGSATAAGIAPLSLGSDTNGSIRVPSSLCGLFGLKPTYGRLPRTGTYPFCDSLDHLGPLARSARDLALCFDVLQGYDSNDPACADKPVLTTTQQLQQGVEGLRFGVAGGYFDTANFPVAAAAVQQVASAVGAGKILDMQGTSEGRAAAYLITNAESSALHRDHLIERLEDFDSDTRDRFLAGSLQPASWYLRAQAVRRWYQEQVLEEFKSVDIIIAPATPCVAPKIGSKWLEINGEQVPLRPNLGLFTQPFSAIGLPVCTVPLWLDEGGGMPIGVQLVAPPWREDLCLRVAYWLEKQGIADSRRPSL